MDSDTLTYHDMTPFLLQFAESNKQFFFVKDHVMFNSDFVANWTLHRPLGVVPQACFMGFKFSIIRPFFSLWRNIWEQWISPLPFANFPDPNPNFVGSMFCIEQYALAMALAQFLGDNYLGEDAVMLFERELILLQHSGQLSFDIVTKIPGSLVGAAALSGVSGLNLSGIGYRISGVNVSGLGSGINLSGLAVSGLLQAFSGLNISGITSGLNLSGISVSGFLASLNVSGGFSGLSVSGLQYLLGLARNVSGINVSALSISELIARLGISGLNLSGINMSGLTLSELEKLIAGGTVNLSGVDFKYLQGADASTYSNLTLIDKFGNSFIHYYNQNFDSLKEGSMQGGQFSELFTAQQEQHKF